MEVTEFFELVLERIEQHPRYSILLKNAVAAQDQLVLNYHSHAPNEPFCVSVGVYDGVIPMLQIAGEYRELAHIRAIGRDASECAPLMNVFAALLQQKYELRQPPRILLEGQPFEG